MGVGHSHTHSHDHDVDVEVGRLPRLVLVLSLVLAGVATIAGVVAYWPSAADLPDKVQFLGKGVTEHQAAVVSVTDPCPVIVADPFAPPGAGPTAFPEHCNEMTVRLLDGQDEGTEVTMKVETSAVRSGLVQGDTVNVLRLPPQEGRPDVLYSLFNVDRLTALGLLTGAFVLVVLLVARLRGFLALVGLAFAAVVVGLFMLPALLAGESGLGVALAGSAVIMYVVLYLAHGLSIRTSTALAGTFVGILVTAGLGMWGVYAVRLSGISDESEMLLSYADQLNYQGVLICAVIVAGLGVLNDVTITQSSSVWELRAAAPDMSRARLFASGMRIGRDHIASTIYTIVFAYAGTSLAVLLLLSLYDRSLVAQLSDEPIATEVVLTLSSAIGLVVAVPATTAIAALTVAGPHDLGGRRRGGRRAL